MRALLITHHWPPNSHHSIYSGYERLSYYMDNLCDIDILTWKSINQKEKNSTGIKTIYTLTPASDVLLERRLLISLKAYKLAENYDIIHSLYPVPALLPSLKYSTLATVHITSDIDTTNLWLKYETLYQRAVFKNCKLLIAVSTNLKELLEKKYRCKNVVYIPHGVDVDYFRPSKMNSTKKIELIQNKYELISLTTGIYGTDFRFIIELAKEFPNILFVIIGNIFIPNFKNILHLPKVSEAMLKELYSISDIFIKPLKFATANNSILEAMAMGKAIITEDIGGISDYLDEKCAYLVRNKRGYNFAIEELFKDEQQRKILGENARRKTEREFDWRIISNDIYSTYKTVLED